MARFASEPLYLFLPKRIERPSLDANNSMSSYLHYHEIGHYWDTFFRIRSLTFQLWDYETSVNLLTHTGLKLELWEKLVLELR